MHIKKLTFTEEFRCFPKGTEFEFPNRVTVIVGDNGAGKSSLIGTLRSKFETTWTMSQIHNRFSPIPSIAEPAVPAGIEMNYVDLATDLMKSSAVMSDDVSLHVKTIHKSSGQASLLQLAGMFEKTRAKVHVIDEPERGLSPCKVPVMAALLAGIIEERPDDQFFVVTHSLEIAKSLADEVLTMPEGLYLPPTVQWLLAAEAGKDAAKRYTDARKNEWKTPK